MRAMPTIPLVHICFDMVHYKGCQVRIFRHSTAEFIKNVRMYEPDTVTLRQPFYLSLLSTLPGKASVLTPLSITGVPPTMT